MFVAGWIKRRGISKGMIFRFWEPGKKNIGSCLLITFLFSFLHSPHHTARRCGETMKSRKPEIWKRVIVVVGDSVGWYD